MMSRLLTRREQFVLGFLAVSLIVGAITVFVLRSGQSAPSEIIVTPAANSAPAAQPSPASVEPAATREVVVSVQGAVAKPGVYTVDEGSRVHELIQRAGGLMSAADTSGLNLAARVVDGTTLTVPTRAAPSALASTLPPTLPNPDAYLVSGGATTGATGSQAGGSPGGLIDLNVATQAQLETLPGIGPKLAQQIIQYRELQPFRDVSDLDNVSGIGPAKLEALRGLVTVN